MKPLLFAALTTLGAMCAVPCQAQAQFSKMEDAVKYRKGALFVLGTHFSQIGAVVKGERPYDQAATEADAAIVDTLIRLPWHAFPEGSESSDSRARPEVWKQRDKFQERAKHAQGEVSKLRVAAQSGDLAAIRSAFGATGQSCKACHDDFRRR